MGMITAIKNLIKPYVGVPAPEVLLDDPWFGPAPETEKSISLKESRIRAEQDNQILPQEKEDDKVVVKEVDNIHEVMYNIATRSGQTTTQLDPMPELGGGSENFQSGPGDWMSGTGRSQFY